MAEPRTVPEVPVGWVRPMAVMALAEVTALMAEVAAKLFLIDSTLNLLQMVERVEAREAVEQLVLVGKQRRVEAVEVAVERLEEMRLQVLMGLRVPLEQVPQRKLFMGRELQARQEVRETAALVALLAAVGGVAVVETALMPLELAHLRQTLEHFKH